METKQQPQVEPEVPAHTAARPMKVVSDRYGAMWLCDDKVDEEKSLKEQGCWQCGDLAFTRDD